MERLYKKKTICTNCKGELAQTHPVCSSRSCFGAATEETFIETKNYPRILKVVASALAGVLSIGGPLVVSLVVNDKSPSDLWNFFQSSEQTSISEHETPTQSADQLPADVPGLKAAPTPNIPDIQVVVANWYARGRIETNTRLVAYVYDENNNPRNLEFATYVKLYPSEPEAMSIPTLLPNELINPNELKLGQLPSAPPGFIIYVSGSCVTEITSFKLSGEEVPLSYLENGTSIRFSAPLLSAIEQSGEEAKLEISLSDDTTFYATLKRRQ